MQVVKKANEYTIYKKRSGRHAILNKEGKYVRGDDKKTILLKEGLIKLPTPKKRDEAPAAEGAATA